MFSGCIDLRFAFTLPCMSEPLPAFTVSAEYAAAVAKGQVAAQAPKPGVQTTEFWLHLASLAMPVIMQLAGQSQSALAIAGAQVAAALYTLARTWIKSQGAKGASAVAAATINPPAIP